MTTRDLLIRTGALCGAAGPTTLLIVDQPSIAEELCVSTHQNSLTPTAPLASRHGN